ncbi:hypothetical protein ABPG72_007763 [Tetrahymena utriculariae]
MSIEETTDIISIEKMVSFAAEDKLNQIEVLRDFWNTCSNQIKSITLCQATQETRQNIIPQSSDLKQQFKTIIYLANDNNSFYRAVFIHFLINLFANGQAQQVEYLIRTVYQLLEKDIKFTSRQSCLNYIDKQAILIQLLVFLNGWNEQKKQRNSNLISIIINGFSTDSVLDFISIVVCKNLFQICYERNGLSEAIQENDKINMKKETEGSLEALEEDINFQIVSLASEVFQSNVNIYFVDAQQNNVTQKCLYPFVNDAKQDNEINILFSDNRYFILLKKEMDSLQLEKFDNRSLESQLKDLTLIQQQQQDDFEQSQMERKCSDCQQTKQTIFCDSKYRCTDCFLSYSLQKYEIKIVNQDCKISPKTKQINEMLEKAVQINKRYFKSKSIQQYNNQMCDACKKINQITYQVQKQYFCLKHIQEYGSQYPGKKFENTTSDECRHALDLINNNLISKFRSDSNDKQGYSKNIQNDQQPKNNYQQQNGQNLYQQFNQKNQEDIWQGQGKKYHNEQKEQKPQQQQQIKQRQNPQPNNQFQPDVYNPHNQHNQQQWPYQNQGQNFYNNQIQQNQAQNNLMNQIQHHPNQFQAQNYPNNQIYQGMHQGQDSNNQIYQQPFQFQGQNQHQIYQQPQQYQKQLYKNNSEQHLPQYNQQVNQQIYYYQQYQQQYPHQNQGENNPNGYNQQQYQKPNEYQGGNLNQKQQFNFQKSPINYKQQNQTFLHTYQGQPRNENN